LLNNKWLYGAPHGHNLSLVALPVFPPSVVPSGPNFLYRLTWLGAYNFSFCRPAGVFPCCIDGKTTIDLFLVLAQMLTVEAHYFK
jgi:hypothetical protein